MAYRLRHWLRHQVEARGIYATHSPFLYELLKRHQATHAGPYWQWDRQARRALARKSGTVIRTDFGAHGRQAPFLHRRWKEEMDIEVRPAWVHRLLYHLVSIRRPRQILEVGTSVGFSTLAMAAALPEHDQYAVYGLEGDANIRQEAERVRREAERVFPAMKLPDYFGGRARDALSALLPEWKPVDLVVLDTLPRYDVLHEQGLRLLDALSECGLLVLMAPYRSPGATAAWEALRRIPGIRFAVDGYHLGLLSFDPGLNPEHRKVRFWG